jgi:hypothetical protein
MKRDSRPGGLRAALRARWPAWRAALTWIVGSWVRPAGAAAHWEQDPKRSRPGSLRARAHQSGTEAE